MRFRIRLHDPRLLIASAPSNLVLEITRGNSTDSFALSRDDIAALSALTFQLNAGMSLPLEAGEP
jgi:hypothetical protein